MFKRLAVCVCWVALAMGCGRDQIQENQLDTSATTPDTAPDMDFPTSCLGSEITPEGASDLDANSPLLTATGKDAFFDNVDAHYANIAQCDKDRENCLRLSSADPVKKLQCSFTFQGCITALADYKSLGDKPVPFTLEYACALGLCNLLCKFKYWPDWNQDINRAADSRRPASEAYHNSSYWSELWEHYKCLNEKLAKADKDISRGLVNTEAALNALVIGVTGNYGTDGECIKHNPSSYDFANPTKPKKATSPSCAINNGRTWGCGVYIEGNPWCQER
jgi:hypothetical protein